jgi:membrane associated rhomboid family serine protease
MIIPIRDSHPSGIFPYVTMGIILVNSLVWFYEISLGPGEERFLVEYSLIPARFLHFFEYKGGLVDNALVPLVSSLFLHASWMHVLGNMWYLWIFGDNIEDRLGHFRFFVFYLLCGIGASLVHVIFNPLSGMPCVGASGAIAGVLAAYLVSYPLARVLTLVIIWPVEIPALIFLGLWFFAQFMAGTAQLSERPDVPGVAYWAHIGGFVIGILVLAIFPKNPGRGRPTWSDGRSRGVFTRW